MKLPEYRNQPHYLQWLVAWHLTRDYTEFEVAYRSVRMGVEVLTEHVEAQALRGIGEAPACRGHPDVCAVTGGLQEAARRSAGGAAA